MDWFWSLLDDAGGTVAVPSVMEPEQRFPSQSDAETWIGEAWPQLLAGGVAAVVLHESERVVYGPMSLRPPG